MVGIDDGESADALDAPVVDGNDAVVAIGEDFSEEGDAAAVSHDDGAFDARGDGAEGGRQAAGAERPAGGAEDGEKPFALFEPIDDFAAGAGRRDHYEAAGSPRGFLAEHDSGEDAAERMRDEMDRAAIAEAGDLFLQGGDDGVNGRAAGGVGEIEGGVSGGLELAGERLHRAEAAPEAVEEHDFFTAAAAFPRAIPGERGNQHLGLVEERWDRLHGGWQ